MGKRVSECCDQWDNESTFELADKMDIDAFKPSLSKCSSIGSYKSDVCNKINSYINNGCADNQQCSNNSIQLFAVASLNGIDVEKLLNVIMSYYEPQMRVMRIESRVNKICKKVNESKQKKYESKHKYAKHIYEAKVTPEMEKLLGDELLALYNAGQSLFYETDSSYYKCKEQIKEKLAKFKEVKPKKSWFGLGKVKNQDELDTAKKETEAGTIALKECMIIWSDVGDILELIHESCESKYNRYNDKNHIFLSYYKKILTAVSNVDHDMGKANSALKNYNDTECYSIAKSVLDNASKIIELGKAVEKSDRYKNCIQDERERRDKEKKYWDDLEKKNKEDMEREAAAAKERAEKEREAERERERKFKEWQKNGIPKTCGEVWKKYPELIDDNEYKESDLTSKNIVIKPYSTKSVEGGLNFAYGVILYRVKDRYGNVWYVTSKDKGRSNDKYIHLIKVDRSRDFAELESVRKINKMLRRLYDDPFGERKQLQRQREMSGMSSWFSDERVTPAKISDEYFDQCVVKLWYVAPKSK